MYNSYFNSPMYTYIRSSLLCRTCLTAVPLTAGDSERYNLQLPARMFPLLLQNYRVQQSDVSPFSIGRFWLSPPVMIVYSRPLPQHLSLPSRPVYSRCLDY